MNEMNITSAQYLEDEFGTVTTVKAVIDGQELYVPMKDYNRHYAAILDWVADGNTIADAD